MKAPGTIIEFWTLIKSIDHSHIVLIIGDLNGLGNLPEFADLISGRQIPVIAVINTIWEWSMHQSSSKPMAMHILQSVWMYDHKPMPQPMLYCITACGGILNTRFEPGTV